MNNVKYKHIWFTGDTHFGHANIIRFSKRPFSSIEEHDRQLIENWNSVVDSNDDVYFLGDFSYRSKHGADYYRNKLKGNIFFIQGNHDKEAMKIKNRFAWFKEVCYTKINDQKVFLSHYAHRVWPSSHHGTWHLYGHSHNSLPDIEEALSIDVGVDAAAARFGGKSVGTIDANLAPCDYKPFQFADIETIMSYKKFVPIDHHGR